MFRNKRFASFNDDTSPDSRLTGMFKVRVNAQVPWGTSLEWLVNLRYVARAHGKLELKSRDALSLISRLDPADRVKVNSGLRIIRIQIVDPRPFRRKIARILRNSLNDPNAGLLVEGILSRRSVISDHFHRYIADSILHCSGGSRLDSAIQAFGMPSISLDGKPAAPPEPLLRSEDLDEDPRIATRKALTLGVQSDAAFHDALELVFSGEALQDYRFISPDLIRRRLLPALLESHAFDRGDTKQIALLEDVRSRILGSFNQLVELYGNSRYAEVDSKDSLEIQAADIAAGKASVILANEGLGAVARDFDHVTYNGRRVDEGLLLRVNEEEFDE